MNFGSLQHWGLAPPTIIPDTTSPILLVENGDLRYFFKNLKPATFFIYERSPALLAKFLVKFALLHLIATAETTTEKIDLAHSYQEICCNVRISEGAQTLLETAVNACISSFLRGRVQTPTSEFLAQKVGFGDLKSTQKDDIFNCLKGFLKRNGASEVETSFNQRLRNHLQERYDSLGRICLWPYHFDLICKIPYTHEIFYKSFKTEGISHLRAYFRLPECLGAKERPGAVGRRAATSEESKMYCGIDNTFFGKFFDGDQELGPWMECCYDVYDETKRVEFESFFSPQGQDSFETTYTNVELAVINLIYCGEKILSEDWKVQFLMNDFIEKAKYEHFFGGAVLSLEGVRFAEKEAFWNIFKDKYFVLGELAEFIPEFKDREAFGQKVVKILHGGDLQCCGGPFKEKMEAQGKKLGNTHVLKVVE